MTSAIRRPASLSRRSGLTSLTLRLAGAGGMFLSHIVLARALGVEAFGEYSLAVAWLQILTVVGKLGLDNTSLRYVSEYVTRGEVGKLRGFLAESVRASVLASLGVTGLGVVTVFVCWPRLGDHAAWCLMVALTAVPIVALRQIREASLRGVGRLLESQIGTAIWPLVLSILAGTAWFSLGASFTSPVAMLLHLVSLGSVLLLVCRYPYQLPNAGDQSFARAECFSVWQSTAMAFLFAEVLIAVKARACIGLAGMLLDRPSVGLYGAMEKFADVSLLLSQSLGIVIAPQFASLYAAGRFAEMRKLMRQGQLLGLGFTLPVALAVGFLGDYVFALLGPGYRDGWSVLIALLVSACIAAFSGPAAYVLQMTGRERTILAITAACAATNILFSLLLMKRFGILGLGLAQIATSLVWTAGVRGALCWHPAWQSATADEQNAAQEVTA
ncbi:MULTISPECIES: lipopolysaccharide biosynthesis protein [unclassified Schlesneria]|uniref:lipopolysaccharide biosynthesis protein n=1 Tax=unclassified Schlesneria TaxID=2762017 RepID=UPI002F253A53